MNENSYYYLWEFPRLHRGNALSEYGMALLHLLYVATGLQMKNSGNVLLFISRYDWYSAPYATENNYCFECEA